MLIADKDIQSRLKKARAAREKDAAAYSKGATEVAGWETGQSNADKQAAEEAKSKRSNLSKAGDFLKSAGHGIAESYTSLGHTLGTIAAQVSPDVKHAQAAKESATKDALHQMSTINLQRFPENGPPLSQTDPAKDARLKKAFQAIHDNFQEVNHSMDWNDKAVSELSVKKTAGDVASITGDILSAGTYGGAAKGARTARLAKAAETGSKVVEPVVKTAIKGAAKGAAINTATQLPQELLDNEQGINLKRLGANAGLGAVLGGLGDTVAVRGSNKAAKAASEADRAMMSGVDESAASAASHLDAMDKFAADTAPTGQKLLGTGEDRMQRRISEIDKELEGYRQGTTDPNTYSSNPESLDSLKGEPAGNPRINKSGEINATDAKKTGVFAEDSASTVTSSKDTVQHIKELQAEKAALEKEAAGLQSITKYDGAHAPKLDVKDPQFATAVDNELQAVDNSHVPTQKVAEGGKFVDKQTGKVNALVDYFRTPTKVLDKIGLKDTRQVVERSFENYRKDLGANLKQLSDWEARVGNDPQASQRIFKWLDGDKSINLTGEQLKVATEMKSHLEKWADKLGLDKNQRVTDYITHIFEGDLKGKSNDVTLSSILDNKGTTKAYNPFTQKRLGTKGYKEDAFAAMEAYMKKSTRQVNMDPALKITADAAKNVDDRTARYLLKLNQSIAMKPDKFEQMINDVVSSIPGVEDKFGNQGGTKLMRGWRNTVYRATLGMNVGSALRNLTQGTNTFAELGTRRTLQGYSALVRAMGEHTSGKGSKLWDEMEREGIFGDAFHTQDRTVTTLKKGLQKADKGLWAMFDLAEKINRGSAYAGAKAAALGRKMSEEEAIAYAKKVVGDTQFRFNDVETPVILRSQAAKTLGQFQSFNLKQAEFLGGKAKSTLKTVTGRGSKQDVIEMYKLARWVGANIAVASTVGTVLGLKWTDAIPDFGAFRGVRSPLLTLGNDVKDIAMGKNEYGQDTSRGDLLKTAGKDAFGLVAPGGTQIKKTAEGYSTAASGESKTDSGKLRYTVDPSAENKVRGALFGPYNLDEGQNYFAHGRQALTQKQTDVIDAVPSGEEKAYETMFRNMAEKHDSKQNTANKIREEIKNKNFVKAKRLADAHNAEVEKEISNLSGSVGIPPKDIVDYIRSTYKVNYEYYLRNKK